MDCCLGGIGAEILFYSAESKEMDVSGFTNSSNMRGHGQGDIKGNSKILNIFNQSK